MNESKKHNILRSSEDTIKAVRRGKIFTVSAYIKKLEKIHFASIVIYSEALEQEEIILKVGREK